MDCKHLIWYHGYNNGIQRSHDIHTRLVINATIDFNTFYSNSPSQSQEETEDYDTSVEDTIHTITIHKILKKGKHSPTPKLAVKILKFLRENGKRN